MLIASLGAALVRSAWAVAMLRVIQVTSSGALIGRTMVRDLYSHERAARGTP